MAHASSNEASLTDVDSKMASDMAADGAFKMTSFGALEILLEQASKAQWRARPLLKRSPAIGGGLAAFLAAAGAHASENISFLENASGADANGEQYRTAASAGDLFAFAEICATGAAQEGAAAHEGHDAYADGANHAHASYGHQGHDSVFASRLASRFGGLENHEGHNFASSSEGGHHSAAHAGHGQGAVAASRHAGHGGHDGAQHSTHGAASSVEHAMSAGGDHSEHVAMNGAAPAMQHSIHAGGAAGQGAHKHSGAAAEGVMDGGHSAGHIANPNPGDVETANAEAAAEAAASQPANLEAGGVLVAEVSGAPVEAAGPAWESDVIDLDDGLSALLGAPQTEEDADTDVGSAHSGHDALAFAFADAGPDAILPAPADI